MLSLNDIVHPMPGVVSRKAGEEQVVVLPKQGKYVVLNANGAEVWQMVDGRRTLGDIAAALAEGWKIESDQAEADVLQLAGQLLERGALGRKESDPVEGEQD